MLCAMWPVGNVCSPVVVFSCFRCIFSSSRSMTAPTFFRRLIGVSGGTPGDRTTV